MAGANQVVCSFFGVVYERLDSLIYNDQIHKFGPLVKELKKLFKSFHKIKEVVDDAEEKQFNEKAVRVRVWLQELNVAAYEADDVFDEFEYEALQQLASQGASSSSNVTEQLNGKIRELIGIFHELAEECSGLELQKEKEKSVVVSPDRITMSLSTEPQVYGRDENIEQLVKQLLPRRSWANHPKASQWADASSSSSKDTISVFPILGMGGVGKTTLAQRVYHDKRVENHFKDRSWICVSYDFAIERLMKAIITSISRSECTLNDLELLRERLQNEVHGKRLLLVLDDVWEDSQEKWNTMMKFFEGVAQGSSIIVTTRLSTVASITSARPSDCLKLSGLSENDCWALFKQYAFGPENEERLALVKIGKEIVKKCGGLPLAVKTLGSLLRFKSEESEWQSIKDNPIWELHQSSQKGILPALRLSYGHLSPELKRCFVHCSIFRKDHVIIKKELIQLWMANGLVKSRANIELEDTGNEIFNALLWRSFFQDTMKDKDGNIISCKMHDLVHDLASSFAGDEYIVEDSGSVRNVSERTRHVSPLKAMDISSPSLMDISSPSIRSLNADFFFESCFSDYFIRLRALTLKNSGIKEVPDCIGKMIHLRCLNLAYNDGLKSLPESICSLRNMQTLNLSSCRHLQSLPENIGDMSNLRHLDLEGCHSLSGMPLGIGQLTCLRTLCYFVVGKGESSGIGGLQLLNKLGETLTISKLVLVKNAKEAKEANLMSKKDVRSLGLIWPRPSYLELLEGGANLPPCQRRQQENVIEGLQPHVNVRELKVEGYQGETLSPSWLTEASLLPNLVRICLSRCPCEHLWSLRKFPRLQVLKLFQLNSLKFIVEEVIDGADDANAGVTGFPSLEVLRLEGMHNLEGWSSSSSLSSSSERPSLEEPMRNLEEPMRNLEEPMRNLEGSSSSSSSIWRSLCAVEIPCLKRKSAKKLEREGGGGLPLSSSSLSQPPITQQAAAVFPRLKSVTLDGCPKLKGGIPLARSPVQDVHINGENCNGTVLASLRDLRSLPSLKIDGFRRLESFPPGTLTNLTALHKLEICNCDNLKALPVELYSLTTLTELNISQCPNLVSLAAEEREGGLKNLSSLKTLSINGCHALKRLPQLDKTLETLSINGCHALKRLPQLDKTSLHALTELNISQCPNLVSLAADEREGGLKNHFSLKTLSIKSCHALKRLPQLDRTSLHALTIQDCDEMEFSKEDFEHLVVLEEIKLYGLPKLTCFPEGLKDSAAIRRLRFRPCHRHGHRHGAPVDLPNWIGTALTSLEYLEFDAPKNLNVLPQWMKHLTALKKLDILRCDEELVKQWKDEEPKRWKDEELKRWKNRDGQREDNNSFNMIYHVEHVYISEKET